MAIARIALWAFVVALAAGCASPSDPAGMVAKEYAPGARSAERVSVTVLGGKETSAAGMSQISNEAFREALKRSITQSALFREVVDDKGGRYQLQAFIGNMSQPMFGASFTVTMEVDYTLTETGAAKPVWQQQIRSSHTATMGEAFAGVERLRLANEGAARKNIEAALREMGKLPLR